jgi:hypothetical protein
MMWIVSDTLYEGAKVLYLFQQTFFCFQNCSLTLKNLLLVILSNILLFVATLTTGCPEAKSALAVNVTPQVSAQRVKSFDILTEVNFEIVRYTWVWWTNNLAACKNNNLD